MPFVRYYNFMIKIFGHISPDTDATGSAILWAWYMNHISEPATPYVLGPLNKETSFVLGKWGIAEPELLESLGKGDEITIVDTNNPQELPSTLSEATIKRIIDHHLLAGGLSTKFPIEVTIRPLACTATVIHDLMGEGVLKMPKEMKGLMLSCILSDTLAFRSPTTTSHDKDVAEKLAKDLKISIKDYSEEMFLAKSDVSDFTDKGLVHLDSKKYPVGDKNIRVSSLETTNPKAILDRKAGIISAIKEVIAEDGDIDDVLLFVIDILKEEATVFTYNEFTKSLVEESFGVSVEADTKVLPGILSRKKQIVPVLKLPIK
jgi:manganese-dependent inorganic pyrophosphatase